LYQLIGGARSTTLPCYASLLRYTDPKLVAQYSERALKEGFGAVKLHEVTEPAVGAARAAIGAGTPLMVDVNCEWSQQAAIEAALSFTPHRLEWLEEPVFPPEDFRALHEVGKAAGMPLAAGENLCYATQFAAQAEARAVAYAQPSVTKVGGVSEFLKVVELGAAHGIRIAPHSPYFGPGAVATLHLIAARVPEARFELFYLWAEATLYPGLFGKHEVAVPVKPGLGINPDAEVMSRYRA
jgi:L-alanine-DL-glutamate epimerase-like enolase superfamily enzyme